MEPTKTNQIGDVLRELRGDVKAAELARRAGVHRSLISRLEAGKKSLGHSLATKLADALQLRGDRRTKFLDSAMATSKQDRIDPAMAGYPPAAFAFLPRELAKRGVSDFKIADMVVDVKFSTTSRIANTACHQLAREADQRAKRFRSLVRSLGPHQGTFDLYVSLKDGSALIGELIMTQVKPQTESPRKYAK